MYSHIINKSMYYKFMIITINTISKNIYVKWR